MIVTNWYSLADKQRINGINYMTSLYLPGTLSVFLKFRDNLINDRKVSSMHIFPYVTRLSTFNLNINQLPVFKKRKQ